MTTPALDLGANCLLFLTAIESLTEVRLSQLWLEPAAAALVQLSPTPRLRALTPEDLRALAGVETDHGWALASDAFKEGLGLCKTSAWSLVRMEGLGLCVLENAPLSGPQHQDLRRVIKVWEAALSACLLYQSVRGSQHGRPSLAQHERLPAAPI